MITTKKIIRNYQTGKVVTEVLKGIDLEISEGEFVAIMGKSGAGKSTLMYQMSLLDTPTSGEIIIDGQDTAELKARERTGFRLQQMGYVFQNYALLPELTARENVMIPLLMLGYTTRAARGLAEKTLDQVGLGHRYTNKPSQLSGGEQQRVSIARALAHKPKVLFADEPTANLDSVSSENVLKLFGEIHAAGQTIVMVTHEREYADYAERILFMEDGKIVDEVHTP